MAVELSGAQKAESVINTLKKHIVEPVEIRNVIQGNK
jgi:hypothetical protein